MSNERGRLRVIVFSVSWMLVVLICTAFVLKLIWDLWFPPFLNPESAEVSPKIAQMQALADGIQPETYVVAYKAMSGEAMADRFHDWQIPSPRDTLNVCITCHGDMPHNNDVKTRAFLNAHDMHVACETCHIDAAAAGAGVFAWYDVETGDIRRSIEIEAPLVITHNKLLFTANGDLSNYRDDALMNEANNLLREAAGLTVAERRQHSDRFHENQREEALECRACHTGTDLTTSFVPYTSAGYSVLRARQINNTEVVGMIERYDPFYLPTFLSGQGVTR